MSELQMMTAPTTTTTTRDKIAAWLADFQAEWQAMTPLRQQLLDSCWEGGREKTLKTAVCKSILARYPDMQVVAEAKSRVRSDGSPAVKYGRIDVVCVGSATDANDNIVLLELKLHPLSACSLNREKLTQMLRSGRIETIRDAGDEMVACMGVRDFCGFVANCDAAEPEQLFAFYVERPGPDDNPGALIHRIVTAAEVLESAKIQAAHYARSAMADGFHDAETRIACTCPLAGNIYALALAAFGPRIIYAWL